MKKANNNNNQNDLEIMLVVTKLLKTIQSDNYQMYPNSHDICGIKSYMHF